MSDDGQMPLTHAMEEQQDNYGADLPTRRHSDAAWERRCDRLCAELAACQESLRIATLQAAKDREFDNQRIARLEFELRMAKEPHR